MFMRDRNWDILEYDTSRYPFRTLIERTIGENDLEGLQLNGSEVFKRANDQSTPWHKLFYSKRNELLLQVYGRFIRNFIRPLFREPIVYQTIPTFRVHLRHNVAVGEFHKDTDYGHSPKEINFWLPVTKAFDSNTVWFTPHDGTTHLLPADLNYGQVLVFSGARTHGNKINQTNITRVSFDFRALGRSDYAPSDRVSINAGLKFEIGSYFSEQE
jgi:ectoine hydroxylase-related dioxygenase (phytanoyl-CoA dioxygenase family)